MYSGGGMLYIVMLNIYSKSSRDVFQLISEPEIDLFVSMHMIVRGDILLFSVCLNDVMGVFVYA